MSATDRPADPKRYARVEQLLRAGEEPDHEIVKIVAAEFDCCKNTVRSDMKALWIELREHSAEKREHRRDAMRYDMEVLRGEARRISRIASTGFSALDREGNPVVIQDLRTASFALATAEKASARLALLDGLNESDSARIEALRQKLAAAMTGDELESALWLEIERLVTSMPEEKWAALTAKRAAIKPGEPT